MHVTPRIFADLLNIITMESQRVALLQHQTLDRGSAGASDIIMSASHGTSLHSVHACVCRGYRVQHGCDEEHHRVTIHGPRGYACYGVRRYAYAHTAHLASRWCGSGDVAWWLTARGRLGHGGRRRAPVVR